MGSSKSFSAPPIPSTSYAYIWAAVPSPTETTPNFSMPARISSASFLPAFSMSGECQTCWLISSAFSSAACAYMLTGML